VDLTWWRKDRDPGSVFVDYNQNARDHTIASAYSVRGTPEGVVSAPLLWEEIATRIPRTSHRHHALPYARSAIFTPTSTITSIDSMSCWSGQIGTSATTSCAPDRLSARPFESVGEPLALQPLTRDLSRILGSPSTFLSSCTRSSVVNAA
jgi:hypothetical protein